MFKSVWNLVRGYIGGTSGATLMAFSMSVPVVVGAMGMSVDLARSYLAKERLTHALDAAALAAASSGSLTESQIQARAEMFFHKNYPTGKIGEPVNLVVEISADSVRVTAAVRVDTTFMNLLGVSEVSVGNTALVQRLIRGIEVALVLDVTGSMNTNNNIMTLRTAASNFLSIMCPTNPNNPNSSLFCSESVRVALIPFATTVNVGPYGLGKTPDGAFYDASFVNNPKNLAFNQSKSSAWWGCLLEQAPNNDVTDSQATWRWDMYRYVSNSGSTTSPNTNCNKAYIHPLSNDKTTLQNRINSLTASGNTLSNIGMVWGYRVLSPEFPFREGTAFNNPEVRKVVVLMTDGDNNIGSTYSAYGPWSTYRLTDTNLDQKLVTTCNNMKNDGITIYTVTFTSGINNATKAYFRNCASGEANYYDAPTQNDLVATFNHIARELSTIYVAE